jgi:superfamily II DNA or RNA helicase
MSDLLKLRDYQAASITALHTRWDAGDTRVAVVLPTGAGKTFVFSHMITQWLERNPGKRVLVLAHTEELVTQAYKELRALAPKLSVGIVKAARNQVTADVIIGCVPSLRSARRRDQLRRVGLIITDECHHGTAPTYRKIYAHFGALAWDGTDAAPEYREAPAVMAGYTATLARGDNAKLSEVWQSVAYRKDLGFMIRRGYLRDVTGKRIEVSDLDLSKVKKSGGDYQAADLGDALEASLAPEIVAKAVVEHAGDRSILAFWPTIHAAQVYADAANAEGIKTEFVCGTTPDAERRAIWDRLESGVTQQVSNVGVATEGFNCPRVSCIVVARPTRSAPLYQQMVGRGLRLWCPEHGRHAARIKPEPCCAESVTVGLILDVVGASRVHGLASLVDLSEKDLAELPDEMTLIEAEDLEEIEEEGGAPLKLVHDGPVEAIDFDPLNRDSKSVWNRTTGDVWFLSVGAKDGRYLFLLPSTLPGAEPDTWDVIWCSKSPYGKREMDATEHRGVPMEAAFAWAEDVADDWRMNAGFADVNTVSKRAAWRRQEASAAQLKEMKRRKIELPGAVCEWIAEQERDDHDPFWLPSPCPMSKGEASELIDRHAAGIRIDPIAKWVESHRS